MVEKYCLPPPPPLKIVLLLARLILSKQTTGCGKLSLRFQKFKKAIFFEMFSFSLFYSNGNT